MNSIVNTRDACSFDHKNGDQPLDVKCNSSCVDRSFGEDKPDDGYDVPVAFIIFNRPDVTRRTFEAIAAVRPRNLFLIADGPRRDRPGEAEKVAQTRAIVQAIKWNCEVRVNFSDANLGCKLRVSSGISWVFECTDRAVILEDDCVPTKAFFNYCKDLLSLYRDDKKIMSISGTCFDKDNEPAHYFSNYALMWGWATWADRWALYDGSARDYKSVIFKKWWKRPICYLYWKKIMRNVVSGKVDTWDYQWIISIWRNKGFVCRPTVNLVKNIGFNDSATHTTNQNSSMADMKVSNNVDCSKKIGGREIDKMRDTRDEIVWASINIRSLVYLYFPWINHLKRKKR